VHATVVLSLVGHVQHLHPPRPLFDQPDREGLGADEVQEDLAHDAERRLLVEGRVQLVAGDVEVQEALVLPLHVLVAPPNVLARAVEQVEPLLDLVELPAQMGVLAHHVHGPRDVIALHPDQLLLEVQHLVAQQLVLAHDLLAEGLASREGADHRPHLLAPGPRLPPVAPAHGVLLPSPAHAAVTSATAAAMAVPVIGFVR